MIVIFIRLFLAKMWSLMKNPCSKGENTVKKIKDAKVKNTFPRTTHDMCHFCVGL
jgi:hypothetical protein